MKTEDQIFEKLDKLMAKGSKTAEEEAVLNALDWVLDRAELFID